MARRPVSSFAIVVVLAACLVACSSGDDDPLADASVSGPEGATGGSNEAGGGAGNSGSGSQAGGSGSSGQAGEGGGGAGSGGSAGSGGEEPFVPVAIAAVPAEFARAICDALEACLGAAALREITAREDCDTRVAAELRATDFHYMDMAISSGHVLYNSSELPACLDGVRALGCDVLTHEYPEACVQVLAGNVEIEGECVVSAECQGTAFCSGAASNQCPSLCAELLGEGETCAGNNECGDGLLCRGGMCAQPSRAGAPCGGETGQVCALGFTCMGSTDTEAGECDENAAVQVGDEDDTCEPGGLLCKDGLSCVFDSGERFHCKPYVSADSACRLGLPGQCPAAQYCDAMNVAADGTCRALPGDGDACVLSGVCAPGHACVPEGSDPTCRPIRDNGGACSANQACRSSHCIAGACVPPPVCD